MRATDQQLRPIERQILAVVQQAQGPCPSGEVVRLLGEQGFASAEVKVALWYLVDRNRLRFDMIWRLTAPTVPPHQQPVASVG